MSAIVHPAVRQDFVFPTETCGPRQCVKGDPKETVPIPFHKLFGNISHTVLQVQGPDSPPPKSFFVNVFNGSSGTKFPVKVRSTYTIGEMLEKLKTVLGPTPNLSLNGKPVQLEQTLCELQVKPGATFITYQKCRGG